jgi:hypothetical protein
LKISAAIVGDGAALAYGVGQVGPDPRKTRVQIVAGAVVLTVFLVAVVKPAVVPGFLIWFLPYSFIVRSVGVVVTGSNVVVLERSLVTGRPKRIRKTLPAGALPGPSQRRRAAISTFRPRSCGYDRRNTRSSPRRRLARLEER